jgi:hypothetical protein
MKIFRLICNVFFLGFVLDFAALAQGDRLVFRPVELGDVLVNPGMGITTFQRFNGQSVNPGLEWSEEGPTRKITEEPTDFPLTSIAYCRWFWEALEPEQGKVRWEILDLALEEARQHKQTLAIRLMPYDESHPLPAWYRKCGARRANNPTDLDGKNWQPDFSDPLYLKHWGALVAEAGRRYDGHPFLDTVDISSVGYWGEGWSPYMPSFECQKALIDIYFDAFRRTPLLMNFDQDRALAYATGRGSGWRLDCWGDMRTSSNQIFFPPEMLDVYPQQIVRSGIQEAWTRAPISLESCWVPGHWQKEGWNLDYILEQALRWHVTSVNIKSSSIPPEWKGKFDEFQKKMGYRFLLRRLECPATARPGEMLPVKMWWLNAGVAPPYRPYSLALQLKSSAQEQILITDADLRQWLPGDAVWEKALLIPQDVNPGQYQLRVGLLDPRTLLPVLRLAIQGRDQDGWYRLGEIKIE